MQTPPPRTSLDHFAPHVARFVDGPIRVRAIQTGFYGHTIRRPGDEFGIHSEEEFGEWMERIDESQDASQVDDNDLDDSQDPPADETKLEPKSGKKAESKSSKKDKPAGNGPAQNVI